MKEKLINFFTIFSIIFVIILLYSRYVGTRGLYVKEYTIQNNKVTDNFHGLKVVHISDLHYGKVINKKRVETLVEKINVLEPDLIFLTGDLLNNELDSKQQKELSSLLKLMDARLGKYAISGNHDVEFNYWEDIIAAGDFINLEEQHELVFSEKSNPIIIRGISSNLNSKETAHSKMIPFYEFLDENPELENELKILLIHEPDFIKDINHNLFDIILAGHSHNGQVKIPFMKPLILPIGAEKYYDEHYKIDNTDLYISSGIGNSYWNIRLFNRPSFNFYRIIK